MLNDIVSNLSFRFLTLGIYERGMTMQKCIECAGPLEIANGEAVYDVRENVVISSKIHRTLFEYEIWQKFVCPTCKVVHYELALTNKEEIVPPFLLCPENRITGRKL